MVTADSVKSKIRGLIDKSNAKTGHNDADLTTAVNTLIDGFGQGGVTLPTLTSPGTAADLAEGKQLIDSNGNIVRGNLQEFTADSTTSFGGYLDPYIDLYTLPNGSNIVRTYARVAANAILRSGAFAYTRIPVEMFGDATAADVAKGKTFTSVAGVRAVGTMEPGGGGDFTVTDDGAGNVTITSSAITDNNGNVVIA